MFLIGKKTVPAVSFIIYHEDTQKVSEVSNLEMTNLILEKKVVNAKLENTVVKMTDGSLPVIDENNVHKNFYTLSEGTEDVLSFVDGSGQMWKMSLNVAREFFEHGDKKITNARLNKRGLVVSKHRNFTTALSRSTEHYRHS